MENTHIMSASKYVTNVFYMVNAVLFMCLSSFYARVLRNWIDVKLEHFQNTWDKIKEKAR